MQVKVKDSARWIAVKVMGLNKDRRLPFWGSSRRNVTPKWQTLWTQVADTLDPSGRHFGPKWQTLWTQVADTLDPGGRHFRLKWQTPVFRGKFLGSVTARRWNRQIERAKSLSGEKPTLVSGGRGLWNPQEEML